MVFLGLDYKKIMTKIAYVSSIKTPGDTSAATATPSKGTAIAPPQYINYIRMSEAELLTTLGRENMRILVSTYPQAPQAAAWQRNIERADSFLKGHTVSMAGIQGEIEQEFMGFLEYASTKPQAAVGKRGNSSRIGDIEFEDCGLESGYWDYDPDRTDGSMIFYPANPDYYNCLLRNARLKGIQNAINKYIESCGHHVLYNFIPNLNDVPQIVAIKGNYHNAFITETMRLSGLSREAVTLWLRNGVMRKNAEKGIGALTPEQAIALLAEGQDDPRFDISNRDLYPEPPRIGVLDPLTIGLIIALSSLLVRAYVLTLQYKIAMAEKDGTAFAASSLALLGTFEASPETKDFKFGGGNNTGGGGTGGGGVLLKCEDGYTRNPTTKLCEKDKAEGLSTKTMLMIGGGLAAAAGLFLLSSDNKKS